MPASCSSNYRRGRAASSAPARNCTAAPLVAARRASEFPLGLGRTARRGAAAAAAALAPLLPLLACGGSAGWLFCQAAPAALAPGRGQAVLLAPARGRAAAAAATAHRASSHLLGLGRTARGKCRQNWFCRIPLILRPVSLTVLKAF